MNILIIGCEGRIGKVLFESLKQKHKVFGADISVKDSDNKFNLDITKEDQCEKIFSKINTSYIIDAIINVTYPRSKTSGKKLEEVRYQDFCANINIHLGSYFNIYRCATELFLKNGKGSLISFSSIYGVITPRFEIYEDTEMTCSLEYHLIKSSIIRMNQYYSKKYKHKNIRYNCVSPGGIIGEQDPKFVKKYQEASNQKGLLSPEDIIGSVEFLLNSDSKYISGQNLIIDDGFTL